MRTYIMFAVIYVAKQADEQIGRYFIFLMLSLYVDM